MGKLFFFFFSLFFLNDCVKNTKILIRVQTKPGPEVIKLFSCSADTKIYPAHNC